jgi:thioredoxin 1
MSTFTEINAAQFEGEVLQSAKPVLVDFFGSVCSACVQMASVLEELARERESDLKVVKLNAHDNSEIAGRFRIHYVPTFILFAGGDPVGQRAGRMSKADLEGWIEAALR